MGVTGFDGGQLAKIAKFPLVVKSDDMQKIEDIHLIICHLVMQVLQQYLGPGK